MYHGGRRLLHPSSTLGVAGMLLQQQPGGFHGLELGAPEAVARSRRGRTIKPKRRLDVGHEDVQPPARHAQPSADSSDTADRFSVEDCISDSTFARPSKLRRDDGTSDARDRVSSRDSVGRLLSSRRAPDGERGLSEGSHCKAGGIFKNAAVQILRQAGHLMCTGDITKLAVKHGYINVHGKTPDATMASALYTDIKRKEGHSVFIKPHEGLFGLREWWDLGYRFLNPKEQVVLDEVAPEVKQEDNPFTLAESPPLHCLPAEELVEQEMPKQKQSRSSSPRHFRSNMDALFAAVDEISREEAETTTSASSGDDFRGTRSVHKSRKRTRGEFQSWNSVQHEAAPSSEDLSPSEQRSCSPTETAALLQTPPAVTTQDLVQEGLLKQLIAVSQAEMMVHALEGDATTHPTTLKQAYMQLCKLYSEAGLLEQACSSLAKAMEIGEMASQTS